jgi:hypothetical protein
MSDEELIARLRDVYVDNTIRLTAADRIKELEVELAKAVEALERLARLGNGDRYGNSDGNMIARTTLAELKGEKKNE